MRASDAAIIESVISASFSIARSCSLILEFFGIKSYNSIDENNSSDARCFSIYESKLITTSEKVKDDINLVCNLVADYSSSSSSVPKILNNYSVKVYLSDTGEYLGEKSKFSLSLDELRSLL